MLELPPGIEGYTVKPNHRRYIIDNLDIIFWARSTGRRKYEKLQKNLDSSKKVPNFAAQLRQKPRENSSVGRARPCQGRGRGFESRFSLEKENIKIIT